MCSFYLTLLKKFEYLVFGFLSLINLKVKLCQHRRVILQAFLKKLGHSSPPADFSANAHVKSMAEYEKLWQDAAKDPEKFWGQQAETLQWMQKWNKVLEWNPPHAKWFVGGKLNISANCLDRHLHGPRHNKAAIIWEGEPGEQRILTYQMLHREVCKFANVLKNIGTKSGDRVTIYMPMIPEAAIAMLACARIGAIHSVIFGGYSADAVADRNNDAGAKILITADGGWRRGKVIPSKKMWTSRSRNHLPSKRLWSSTVVI